MRLQDYPKPKEDNGRGIHWIPFTWGQVSEQNKRVADELYMHLRDMNMRWVVILGSTGQEWNANEYLVRKLVGPDPAHPEIMPILRLGEGLDPQTLEKRRRGEPVGLDLARVREVVRHYRTLGVSYFQLYNEPNHVDEWPDRLVPGNAPEIVMEVWKDAALAVIEAGGLPGFPPPAPGGSWPGGGDLEMLAEMLDILDAKLTAAERARLYDKMWVAIHNYFLWHPVLSLPADSHGFKKFVWYEGIIREKLGRELPLLTGEGGLRLGPPPYGDSVTEAQVSERTKESCRYMAQAPEYYFCNCFWLIGSAIGGGSDLWDTASWFRKDGSRQDVVTALKRLGQFERNPQPPEEWFFYRNGRDMGQAQMVKGDFLRAFEAQGGLQACGYPTSPETAEGNLTVQGFEKLTLEREAGGEVRVRGSGAQQVSVCIPAVETLLRAQEISEPLIAAALKATLDAYGPPERLTAGEYRVSVAGQSYWTNQNIIDAFWIAGGRVGFALLYRAGLGLGELANDRQGQYTGQPIEQMNGLTGAEKSQVLAALPPLGERLLSFRIPSIYALLEAQPLNGETIALALKLIGEKYGPPEKLVPGIYAVSLPKEPILPTASSYTNQEIIDAFWVAGGHAWALLYKAGLDLGALARDRQSNYRGPAIDNLPNLSAQEKGWVKAALPARAPVPAPPNAPFAATPVPGVGAIRWHPAPRTAFVRGRKGYGIEMIVLYASGRPLRETLADARRGFHYVIDKDGAIYQTVQDADAAMHSRLSAYLRDTVIRPNYRGLGIALIQVSASEASQADVYTEAQYASLAQLLDQLCQRYRVPRIFPPLGPAVFAPAEPLAYFSGILGASALDGDQSSPGPQFDWSKVS